MKLHKVPESVTKRKRLTGSSVYVQDGLIEWGQDYIACKHPSVTVSRTRALEVLTGAMRDTWDSGKHDGKKFIFRSAGMDLVAHATPTSTGFDFRIYSR